MRQDAILYVFLSLFLLFTPVYGQIEHEKQDWQEQILQQIDVEEFGEQQYAQLLEMLDELALHYSDTNFFRTRQHLTFRTDRCLNQRQGFTHVTAEKQASGKSYLGDAFHHTLRYQLQRTDLHHHQWRFGIVLDKDAGEDWRHHFPFADSFNAFASYSSRTGWLRQAVVGHYRMQLGSGLILNQQFTLGKNLMGSEFLRLSPRLSPHSSAAESGHLQGAAFRLRFNQHFEVMPFVSTQQIEGTLKNDTITAWNTTGYHRTTTEESKRNAAWLTTLGLRTQSMGENWEVGFNLLYNHFQKDFVRPLRQYNTNYFRGHQLTQASIDYRAQYLGFDFRGEAALDQDGGFATIHGIHHPLGYSWNMTALYRYYSKQYHQIMGAAMAESSAMQGEQGACIMLDGELPHGWTVQGYADYWNFSQPQYGCYQPSWGYELSAKATWDGHIASLPAIVSLRYRLKAKEKNNTQTSNIADDIIGYYRNTIDATCSIEPIDGLVLRTQIRGRFYSDQNSTSTDYGMAFSEALVWQQEGSPLKGELQSAWFKADTYDCRLYLTERNILYGFSLPMLYHQGVRYTCTLSYKLTKSLQIEAKYALTSYKDTETISSGLQTIEGNNKHDLWLQFRSTF